MQTFVTLANHIRPYKPVDGLIFTTRENKPLHAAISTDTSESLPRSLWG